MEIKEIDALIRYHKSGLEQYRQHISPASQFLEEQTIKALEELKSYENNANLITKQEEVSKCQDNQEDGR